MRLRRVLAPALGLAVVVAVPASAADRRPLLFGLNDSYEHSDAEAAQHLDLHKPLGTTIARHELRWRSAQPSADAGPEFVGMDRVHRAAEARGMKVVAVLSSVPAWAQDRSQVIAPCLRDRYDARCQPPPARSALPALARFVQAYVKRYDSIAAIEVFNEPNVAVYSWQPRADPAYYTEVLRVVAQAVRQVRPGLPVISGGIGAPGEPVPDGAMGVRDFLDAMYRAGAKEFMDGIGVHPYSASHEPMSTLGHQRTMNDVRSVRDAFGDGGKPLWVTETGYTTTGPFGVTPDVQASWLAEVVGVLLRSPDVPAVIVHTLYDRPDDTSAEGGYGLVRPDGGRKPAYESVRRVVAAVAAERAPKPKKPKVRRKRTRVRCAAPRPPRKRSRASARAASVRCGGRP